MVNWANKPIYVIARYTRWLIKEAKKCEQLSWFFLRNGKFHVERDACGRNVDGKIVVFLFFFFFFFLNNLIYKTITYTTYSINYTYIVLATYTTDTYTYTNYAYTTVVVYA